MRIGRIIGTVVAPVQHPFFMGNKLLLVQPMDPFGKKDGRPVVAADRAQAGVGDRVLIIEEGSSSRDLFEVEAEPVHSTVVGVIDFVEVEGRYTYRQEE
ncbi:MAG: EutN/CcmL family microcompartment protein [Planctomycetes bacterium]|nr:EutN/CcmL family microcompartment protein [Planctomycetota bacterium]